MTPSQLRKLVEQATLTLEVVNLDQEAQDGLAFQVTAPDGNTAQGKLDDKGRARVASSMPGIFVVTFPELDGADWDGDGVLPRSPEPERREVGQHKVAQGERMATIASQYGFARWQTLWDFQGNQELKDARENPNVLLPGDDVAIPSKIQRQAEIPGGTAKYVVNRGKERLIRLRPLDCDLQALSGVRYQARVGDPENNKGIIPDDGLIVLQVPLHAVRGTISLFLLNDNTAPPFEWDFAIQEEALTDSTRDRSQRLINLGLATTLSDGDDETGDNQLALLAYRACVGKAAEDDGTIAKDLVALHDGGRGLAPDDGIQGAAA
jgi:hypothetical protein